MTNERNPSDSYRSGLSDDNFGQPDRDIQVDPALQEGPASSSKTALFAVAIAIILGAVFYGLNNSSVKEAQTGAPVQSQPGVTTGAAPSHPTAPRAAPQGTEIDRAANPPANNNDNK